MTFVCFSSLASLFTQTSSEPYTSINLPSLRLKTNSVVMLLPLCQTHAHIFMSSFTLDLSHQSGKLQGVLERSGDVTEWLREVKVLEPQHNVPKTGNDEIILPPSPSLFQWASPCVLCSLPQIICSQKDTLRASFNSDSPPQPLSARWRCLQCLRARSAPEAPQNRPTKGKKGIHS